MIKFIGVAILLTAPFAASAIDVLPHDRPDTYSAAKSAAAASKTLTSDEGFSPQDGVAQWQDGTPAAEAVTIQRHRTDWTWAMFGGLGLAVGAGGFLLGRRRSVAALAAAAPENERRRAMSTVEFSENDPGFAGMTPRRTGKVADLVTTSDGKTFGVFLERASLLTGKGSGPDTGRC